MRQLFAKYAMSIDSNLMRICTGIILGRQCRILSKRTEINKSVFPSIALVAAAVILLAGCSPFSTPTQQATTPAPTTILVPVPTSPIPSITKPVATPTVSSQTGQTLEKLKQYMLDLINKDRAASNLTPVILGSNLAAQQHADDMLANYYLSHWGTDGMKPYMRYTLAGGFNYEAENSAYEGYDPGTSNVNIDPLQTLTKLEYSMMYDDASSGWGHRDNILNKVHKRVNIGIAYNRYWVTLVQQFEGDYVVFQSLPNIANNVLSLSGQISTGNIDSVALYYDASPQPMSQQQLLSGPHSYSLGQEAGYVIPSPYRMTQVAYVNATKWDVNTNGSFAIEANVTSLLTSGSGVYTVVVWTQLNGEALAATNYSIFLK